MKIKSTILAGALMAGAAFADVTTPAPAVSQAPDFSTLPALSKERLSGSATIGLTTNYTGKGYVITRSITGGEGAGFAAIKLNYDIGKKKDFWSIDSTIAYKAPFSGHTLYGGYVTGVRNPYYPAFGPKYGTYDIEPDQNLENEFAIITAAKYKRDKWNVSMGHQFVHGGLYGAMAKHFRHQGSSSTNEVFIAPEWTPKEWFAAGVKTSLSYQGLHGWWFEPYMTFKAPLVGTENGLLSKASDDLKLAAVLTLGMSATAEYYNYGDAACANGSQAFYLQFSTPWFVKNNFIVTPMVSFHWLGKGGMKANEKSHAKQLRDDLVPFKNFGVVGTLSATYTF